MFLMSLGSTELSLYNFSGLYNREKEFDRPNSGTRIHCSLNHPFKDIKVQINFCTKQFDVILYLSNRTFLIHEEISVASPKLNNQIHYLLNQESHSFDIFCFVTSPRCKHQTKPQRLYRSSHYHLVGFQICY